MRVFTNFPAILAILFDLIRDVETRDQSRASLPAAPPPHLVSPRVVSHSLTSGQGSALSRNAGSSVQYNTCEFATCPVRFRTILRLSLPSVMFISGRIWYL